MFPVRRFIFSTPSKWERSIARVISSICAPVIYEQDLQHEELLACYPQMGTACQKHH